MIDHNRPKRKKYCWVFVLPALNAVILLLISQIQHDVSKRGLAINTEILNDVSPYNKKVKQLPYSVVVTILVFLFKFLLGKLSNIYNSAGNV